MPADPLKETPKGEKTIITDHNTSTYMGIHPTLRILGPIESFHHVFHFIFLSDNFIRAELSQASALTTRDSRDPMTMYDDTGRETASQDETITANLFARYSRINQTACGRMLSIPHGWL